jgi:hypothetical protein
MSFMHPALALAGVLCVAIPIIIHLLLRRRRKPIAWGAMRFLLQAQRKRRRKSRLEQILLLASRCLVVLLLGLALGRPLLQGAGALGAGATRSVYILLDNGLISGVREGERLALERLTTEARRLLERLSAGDRAALITLGSPADGVVLPPSGDIGAVRELINNVRSTDAATDMSGALRLVAADVRASETNPSDVVVVVISSFHSGALSAGALPDEFADLEGVRITALPPAAVSPTNVQVVSIEPLRPVLIRSDATGDGQASVTLRRSGAGVSESAVTTVRVRLAMGDEEDAAARAATATVRWRPGQTEETVNVTIPVGTLAADVTDPLLVAEIDRDALAPDNTLRRPLAAREALRVGVVARRTFSVSSSADRLGAADWLRLAARPSLTTPVDIIEIEPTSIDAPTLGSLDAVLAPSPDLINPVGWERLRRFADAGGLVVVFPPAEATVHIWADDMLGAMQTGWRLPRESIVPEPGQLSFEASNSPMFALLRGELSDLLRPIRIDRALPAEAVSEQTQILLTLADGQPWMIACAPGVVTRDEDGSTVGRGMLMYIASAPTLSWTNLPAMPLMVPLLQEVLRQGVGGSVAAQMASAGAVGALPPRTEELRAPDGGVIEIAPDGEPVEPIRNTGVYRLLDESGGDRGPLAVNADVEAGGSDAQTREVVQEWLLGAGATTNAFAWLESDDASSSGEGATFAARTDADGGLSLPLLFGALGFALLEVVLASLFSHAARERLPDAAPAEALA